jgi:hypothetical protein
MNFRCIFQPCCCGILFRTIETMKIRSFSVVNFEIINRINFSSKNSPNKKPQKKIKIAQIFVCFNVNRKKSSNIIESTRLRINYCLPLIDANCLTSPFDDRQWILMTKSFIISFHLLHLTISIFYMCVFFFSFLTCFCCRHQRNYKKKLFWFFQFYSDFQRVKKTLEFIQLFSFSSH